MSNSLRFIVLIVVFLALAGTAATLQLGAHQRARQLLANTDLASVASVRATVTAVQTGQQRAFLILFVASLAAVVIIALVPAARRESPAARARLHSDMTQMDHLARTTVTQAGALTQERDARIRTEETLHREQLRLNQVLEEKIRLGRDLHDGIIQSLYATGLTLESSRQKRPAQPQEADALVERGIGLLNATIRDVRGYIETLSHAPSPGALSLGAQLSAVLDNVRGHRTTVFSIHLDEAAEIQLGDRQRDELRQIVREAASNALRHGEAQHVTVRLHKDGTQLALLVQDDGHGFAPQAISQPGLGLANLRARAITLGGDLRLTSQPGSGTRIVVTFPARPSSVATS